MKRSLDQNPESGGSSDEIMTDPSNALQSFQQGLLHGEIQLQPGVLDRNIYLYVDHPNGSRRLTYVRLEGTTVTAFVEFVPCELFPKHIETRDAQRK